MGINGILVGTVLIPSPKLGKQQSHQDGPVSEKNSSFAARGGLLRYVAEGNTLTLSVKIGNSLENKQSC